MATLLKMLQSQSGRLSLARITALGVFVLWVLIVLWTLLLGRSYAHFDTVSTVFCLMYFVVIVGKTVDSRLISIKSEVKKNEQNIH